jgi:hypothetical protein
MPRAADRMSGGEFEVLVNLGWAGGIACYFSFHCVRQPIMRVPYLFERLAMNASATILTALLLCLALPAKAAELPRYVAGPVSGFVYNCQEEKQKAPRPEAYVTW